MKPTNNQIQESIIFLKDKEEISIRELANYLKVNYSLAGHIADVLENNGLISEFKGETHRKVIADDSVFESKLIFININHFFES